jgi:methyltransferase (TIGR00027 family)
VWKLTHRWVDFSTGHGMRTTFSWVYIHHPRTCFFDDVWNAFCAEHKERRSLCILGAGYDTRCYRLQRHGATTLWEVDAPSSQREKLRVLAKSGVPSKDIERVNFVACDFTRESFAEKLALHGFPMDAPACFLWEGVTYYLERQHILATLRQVAHAFKSGSVIALDYFQPVQSSPAQVEYTKKAERLGEDQVGFISRQDLEALISEAGLKVVDHLTKDDAGARYFEPAGLDHATPKANYVGYVVAQVP